MTLLDDGIQTLGLLLELGARLLLDTDRIVSEQLFLSGFELTLVAQLGKAGGNLLRRHCVLLARQSARLRWLTRRMITNSREVLTSDLCSAKALR